MKVCNDCKKLKSLDDFAWRNKAKGTKRFNCKQCVKAKDAARYKTDSVRRSTMKENKRLLLDRNLEYVRSYLIEHPCVDCGFTDIRCLDFDHLSDKLSNVPELARVPCSLSRLQQEIAKCEVRCANCHRIKTYERAGWSYATREVYPSTQSRGD